MRSHHGMWSSGYLSVPTIGAKGLVASRSDPVTRLMWIISSNWRTAVRIAKATYRSCAGKSVIEPRVELVMQSAAPKDARVDIWQDGRSVVDFVDGDDWTER